MPHQFVEVYGKRVAVIVDCFEIFIERPSNLKARSQTFSHYKHNNTMKYLVGITPQGSISFISKGWGGRTSDKHVTENCGFLDNLLPGDIVLADRGFDIDEMVGMMCAEVKIPSFTRGRSQMCARDSTQRAGSPPRSCGESYWEFVCQVHSFNRNSTNLLGTPL